MVWIPGGEVFDGQQRGGESMCGLPGVTRDALPVHRVYVDGFWMDATEVTNEQFEKFVARNPHGPDTPFDPAEPTEKKRVHRGGSFLCTDQYCTRYMLGTRGKGEVRTASNHVGFRCVKPPGTTGANQ